MENKRGGKRANAGRPAGAKNKKIKDISERKPRKYNKIVSFTATEEEYNAIKECAESEGISVYTLVKQSVFSHIKNKRYCAKDENC